MANAALLRLLRLLPPETAHTVAVRGLAMGLGPRARQNAHSLATEIAGLRLPNPIGVAAGFDKNAEAPNALLRAGFGFVEVGTITPRPQAGNPKPRVFRLTADRGVVNRLGFNGQGADAAMARLFKRMSRHDEGGPDGLVGINLGANKDSHDRASDYCQGLERLWGLGDYFTINVSSPNTPGLRDLQRDKALDELLERVCATREDLVAEGETARPPLLLKVAPDLDAADIESIAATLARHPVDGLIVSNTTRARPATLTGAAAVEEGGLSGRPLFEKSTEVLRAFRARMGPDSLLIGVGGVEDAQTAYAKIRAGASAVQLYTAMIYQGPGLAASIAKGLRALLDRDGFAMVADAVGVDVDQPRAAPGSETAAMPASKAG